MGHILEQETKGTGGSSGWLRRRLLAAQAGLTEGLGAWIVCAVLLCLMAGQMITLLPRKSLTVDEFVMIPAAYYHLAKGDFQLIHEHPPLSKILAATPLLLLRRIATVPPDAGGAPGSPEARDTRLVRFWSDNSSYFALISYWSRVPLILLAVVSGLLLFLFTRSLFGAGTGLLALFLYALEPTVLAHGRVVQTDVPATFGLLLVVYALRRYLTRPTLRAALLIGAAGALAVLAKFSMLAIGPAYAVFFLVLLWRAPRAGRLRGRVAAEGALAAASLFAVIWAAYFFHSRPLTNFDARWIAESFPANSETVSAAVRALSYLFPTDFVLGIFFQLWHAQAGHQAGLLGMYSTTGWWYYFPVAFALKTPLPVLLLSLLGLSWSAYRLFVRQDRRFLFLLVPFGLYTLFVMASPINIGVRYYLPAYPFLLAGAGALLARLLATWQKPGAARAGALTTLLLMGWAAVEAARAYPDHMSYMNQLAAGRPHWWYLSDSNVEWGDDARALAVYLRRRGERRVNGAFFTGWVTLRFYGVEYVDALAEDMAEPSDDPPSDAVHSDASGPSQPRPRYTAIGASFLNGSTVPRCTKEGRPCTLDERFNRFAAYRDRQPEKIFGNSIYLFREDR
jgi:4-amino-4-deoxy-L-arabinose transferase-like glycosyltransferase